MRSLVFLISFAAAAAQETDFNGNFTVLGTLKSQGSNARTDHSAAASTRPFREVTTAPTGACTAADGLQVSRLTRLIYGCDSATSTWLVFGGATSVDASAITTGTLAAARGGAGTVSGILRANGAGVVSAATAGADFQAPITLTTTGTSGAATLNGGALNIPQYSAGGGGGGVGDLAVSRTSATVLNVAAGKIRFAGVTYDIAAATATITAGSGAGAIELYITAAGVIVLEHATAAGLSITCSGCTASQLTTPAVPAGAYHLATTTVASGAWSTTVTDRRAALGDPAITNGTGIAPITRVAGQTVVAIDLVEVPRLGTANVFTGTMDMSAAPATIVARGAGLPLAGACAGLGQSGSLYVDTSSGGRLHRCLQTGAGVWGWVADNRTNIIRLGTPAYGAGVGGSGSLPPIPATSVIAYPNAGGDADWEFLVPDGGSISSASIRFNWATQEAAAGAVGWTLTIGCWATGTGTSTAFVLGTPVSVSLTSVAGYRALQTPVNMGLITASPASPCTPGSVLRVRLSRSAADAQPDPVFAVFPEVTW